MLIYQCVLKVVLSWTGIYTAPGQNRWLPSSRNGGELSVATSMPANVGYIFKGIEMKILLSHTRLGMKPYVTNDYKTLGEK